MVVGGADALRMRMRHQAAEQRRRAAARRRLHVMAAAVLLVMEAGRRRVDGVHVRSVGAAVRARLQVGLFAAR